MTTAISQSHGARYYYLSYASAPRVDERFAGDPWVRRFYYDLNAAIKELPGERLWLPGFADFMVEPPRERPNQRKIALAEAEVFVPLYSPEYLDREEFRKEREAFRRRLVKASRPTEGENLLPVLWEPCRSASHAADQAHALSVAPDLTDYAEQGMSALCRLKIYLAPYREILGRLAEHIVDTAERSPMSPGAVVQDPVDAWQPRFSEVPFLAVIIAPETDEHRRDRAGRNGYFGSRTGEWRPFQHGGPVVRDVEAAVHRMRMPIRAAEFVPDPDLFANCPGLLMIDPYIVDTEDGRETLRHAVACLRGWVSIAILVDDNAPPHTADSDVVKQVRAQFSGADRFGNHEDWRIEVHSLVERARRRFLASRPAFPPAGPPPSRPRLFDGRPPPDTAFDDPSDSGRVE